MKKIEEIETRLEIAKKKIKKNQSNNKSSNVASLGKAFKISTELVASVLVGSIIGSFNNHIFFYGCCSRYIKCIQIS